MTKEQERADQSALEMSAKKNKVTPSPASLEVTRYTHFCPLHKHMVYKNKWKEFQLNFLNVSL